MEAKIIKTHFTNKLKSRICLVLGCLYGIGSLVPFKILGTWTKRICSLPTEGMPICYGKLKMLAHGFPSNHLVWIVILECQRIIRFLALKFNFTYSLKVFLVSNYCHLLFII